jgi:hypothetical protein
MLTCACDQGALAAGLPSCQIIPQRIVRIYFTTRLRPLVFQTGTANNDNVFLALEGPVGQPAWLYELPGASFPANVLSNFDQAHYYKDTYKLYTPFLDDCNTERADAVTEEVGGLPFFVRQGDRVVNGTVVAKTAEWSKFIEQLRCFNEIGAFFEDITGVIWAMRLPYSFSSTNEPWFMPVPILPQTIYSRIQFPTASTVQKHQFSFIIRRDFADYEFAPVQRRETLVQYNHASTQRMSAPMHLVGIARNNGGNLEMKLYTEIAQAAGVTIIPLDGFAVGTYLPSVYDSTGLLLTGPAAWTYVGNGVWTQPFPAGADYIRYDPAQLAVVPPINVDFAALYIKL